MNWYKKYDENKRSLLKQADIVLEDKDYNAEETKGMYNIIANHIFSQSKKYINSEADKYGDILQDLKEMM